ncbi:MAG TPA: CHASE3 domain-containing protein [Pseudolabrys sp.]
MALATTGKRQSLPNLQPLLLGIGFVLLVAISISTAFLVDRASTDSRQLAQTLLVQNKLANIMLDLRRAESSQRGYLFTDEPSYLSDYQRAEPDAKKLLAELRELSKDNPERQAMLTRVAPLVDAKFAELIDTIRLNQSGRRAEARDEVLRGGGRAVMDQIRNIIDTAIDNESQLVEVRRTQSLRSEQLLLFVTLAGSGLIVLIGAVSVALVRRNANQAETARTELAGTNANLERIVAYRTADLTEANEEIQRFAYIVSHDLRSPLVNIMGFTSELEALRKDIFEQVGKLSADLAALKAQADEAKTQTEIERLGADFDEAIRFIKSSIGNMDRLINAVLKLSREGRRQFTPQRVDMNAMLEAVVQTVTHRAAEQGATVSVADLPPVESDQLAIEQIFSNLVDNALKYRRPEEALHIDISGRGNATHVIYDVRDNGRGIAAQDHQRVFELFRRAGPQDRPGEGIGLAHVRALVRRLGGNMGLNSELGKGSTFTVTLPRRWSVDNRSAA